MKFHLSPKRLSQLFDISIALKGLDGLLEVVGGLLLLFLTPTQIGWLASYVASGELSEDPRDFLANLLVKTAHNISPHGQFVSVVFLLSHGLIKVFLVWQLFRGKLWAYPLTIIVLLFFIVYQIYEIINGHSLVLTALTILDAVIVVLAWQEYKIKKESHNHQSGQARG